MPALDNDKKIFSLLEVTNSIQRTLSARYQSSFWVKAEMNKLNYYPHSGHCYPELVEKTGGKVIAQLKATLWKDDYDRINENFLNVVKAPLKDGITMLFCAKINFDAVHGLALRIVDIDPVFSLGELEREKQESLEMLKKDGIFSRNKSLPFPLIPQRIAIISVQTSKGFADFLQMIEGNPYGYKFFHILFPSLLQGDRAVDSICHQLQRIRKVSTHFDVVAIVRGGGGDVGLSCFNNYRLSKEVALFPIPVLTGIGHATNETVVEMVAYKNAITPTELADYLLQRFHNFSVPVQKAEEIVRSKAKRILLDERQRLQHSVKFFRSVTGNILRRLDREIHQSAKDLFKQLTLNFLERKQQRAALIYKLQRSTLSFCQAQNQEVKQWLSMLRKDSQSLIKHQRTELVNLSKTVANLHPQNVLKRGYSITRVNGKAITKVSEVQASDDMQTILADGTVLSQVKAIEKKSSYE